MRWFMAKKNNINEKQFSVENELKASAALSQEELFQKYNTSLEGLSVVYRRYWWKVW